MSTLDVQSVGGDQPTLEDFGAPPVTGSVGTNRSGHTPKMSGAAQAAAAHEKQNVSKTAKGRIGGGFFGTYKPASTGVISYAQNKIGVLPDIINVMLEIALHAGMDIEDDEYMRNKFLEALVVDVYVNAYSEEKAFEGDIDVDGTLLSRFHIRDVIAPYVGTHYRRYARAMAPFVVAIMQDNMAFSQLLDKRATEMSLNSRSEAVYNFDGADCLVLPRQVAERNAEAKALALSKRKEEKYFGVSGTSALSKAVSDDNSPFART